MTLTTTEIEARAESAAADRMVFDPYKARLLREIGHLSQVQMAQRLGVTQQTMNRLERYGQQPSPAVLDLLASALGVAFNDLFSPASEQRLNRAKGRKLWPARPRRVGKKNCPERDA